MASYWLSQWSVYDQQSCHFLELEYFAVGPLAVLVVVPARVENSDNKLVDDGSVDFVASEDAVVVLREVFLYVEQVQF